MKLPVFDRDREFMFKDVNDQSHIGKMLMVCFFLFVTIVLFVRYTGKKEKVRQQSSI